MLEGQRWLYLHAWHLGEDSWKLGSSQSVCPCHLKLSLHSPCCRAVEFHKWGLRFKRPTQDCWFCLFYLSKHLGSKTEEIDQFLSRGHVKQAEAIFDSSSSLFFDFLDLNTLQNYVNSLVPFSLLKAFSLKFCILLYTRQFRLNLLAFRMNLFWPGVYNNSVHHS